MDFEPSYQIIGTYSTEKRNYKYKRLFSPARQEQFLQDSIIAL